MSGLASSLAVIFVIPLIALAIEPADPVTFCQRFTDQESIEKCQLRAGSENVDWYVGSVCNLQKEDIDFWKCWESAKDRSVNVTKLKLCEKSESDEKRQKCVEASLSFPRTPASEMYQPLKLNKTK